MQARGAGVGPRKPGERISGRKWPITWEFEMLLLKSRKKTELTTGFSNVEDIWQQGRFWSGFKKERLPQGLSGKESACQCRWPRRCQFNPWVGMIPWKRKWQPTLVFLPVKFHGQRSLVGNSPCVHRETDTTEWLSRRKNGREMKTARRDHLWEILLSVTKQRMIQELEGFLFLF